MEKMPHFRATSSRGVSRAGSAALLRCGKKREGVGQNPQGQSWSGKAQK